VQPQSGEVLATVFNRAEIPVALTNKIINILNTIKFNFRTVQPSDSIKLFYDQDTLVRIQYIKNYSTIYNFDIDTNDIKISMLYKVLDKQVCLIKGEITSSLYESMLKAGEKPVLIANYTDVLAWDIDFFTETQNGDSFFVLVDKKFDDTNFIEYGVIYAVRYKGKIGDVSGYQYTDPSGYKDYYDKDGKSMRKAFLKSPLRYSRISSYYSRGRYHPILKIVRPHRGIDYVAPSGTPVSAIGAGTVTFAGWKGGYGRFVEISHASRFKSRYGHLRSFGKGVRSGQRIVQGQVVGYVGTTGLSTGPHLHFELLQNGTWVNPLKIIPPRADPVKAQYLSDFTSKKDSLQQLLYQ
jgi:murein DD-endopeptidase MepM/ murein hydrolase activator NlpD